MTFGTKNQPWWIQVSQSIRTFPTDLAIAIGILVVVNLFFHIEWLGNATILGARIQPLVAIPSLLFLPGYILIAILFPRDIDQRFRGQEFSFRTMPWSNRSIDLIERAALSFGMSVALIPLFALGIGVGWNLTPPVVINGVTIILVVGIALAAIQRFRTPPAQRFTIPIHQWKTNLLNDLHSTHTTDRVVTIFLVAAILFAVGAVGYAIATPYQSDQSTALFLATEDEQGNPIASGYPTTFTVGESQALTVGITNNENTDQAYTIVITLEQIQPGSAANQVTQSTELNRIQATVPEDATWTGRHSVTPPWPGENLRLHYYLYKGDTVPDDPTTASPYRDAYIWIDVTEA